MDTTIFYIILYKYLSKVTFGHFNIAKTTTDKPRQNYPKVIYVEIIFDDIYVFRVFVIIILVNLLNYYS